jgi:hypothetical protein
VEESELPAKFAGGRAGEGGRAPKTPSQAWAALKLAARRQVHELTDQAGLDIEAIAARILEEHGQIPDVHRYRALLIDDLREFLRALGERSSAT